MYQYLLSLLSNTLFAGKKMIVTYGSILPWEILSQVLLHDFGGVIFPRSSYAQVWPRCG